MQATAVEHLHRRLETLACFAADDVDGGNPHVVEIDVASARAFLSHLLVGLTEGQTRQTGRDDEGGNATRPGPPVRAISVKAPARGALVIKRFVPLIT